MKKRILSFLLTLALVAAVFAVPSSKSEAASVSTIRAKKAVYYGENKKKNTACEYECEFVGRYNKLVIDVYDISGKRVTGTSRSYIGKDGYSDTITYTLSPTGYAAGTTFVIKAKMLYGDDYQYSTDEITTTFVIKETEPVVIGKSVTEPSKTRYYTGEKLDMSGAKFVITLDNGQTESFDLASSTAMAELKEKYGYEVKAQFVDEHGNVTDGSSAGTKTLDVKCTKNGVEEYIAIPGGAITVVVVDPPKSDDSGNSLVTDRKGSRYIKADGSFAKSEWITINGKKYYFNSDSYAASNEWRDGKWISADGSCTYTGELTWKNNATGWWVEDTEGWYPVDSWQKIDGVWYYFKPDGYMASNEYFKGYWFNSDGSWDDRYFLSWKSNASGWWVEDISGWWPSNAWLKIDGCWYYFDGSGYMVTNQYVDGWWIGADGVCR